MHSVARDDPAEHQIGNIVSHAMQTIVHSCTIKCRIDALFMLIAFVPTEQMHKGGLVKHASYESQ